MSKIALDELEARCDQLQRRMTDKRQSPTRRGMTPPPSATRPSLLAAQVANAQASSAHNSPAAGSGGGSVGMGSHVPPQPHEISFAVQRLEKEKMRLEEELRLVNTHLQTYRYLMRNPTSTAAYSSAATNPANLPPPSSSSTYTTQNTGNNNPQRGPSPASQSSSNVLSSSVAASAIGRSSAYMTPSSTRPTAASASPPRSNVILQSPSRAQRTLSSPSYRAAVLSTPGSEMRDSHSAGGTPSASHVVPSALPNDQIAAELTRIRKAREEREAQRRLSAAIASGSPSRY